MKRFWPKQHFSMMQWYNFKILSPWHKTHEYVLFCNMHVFLMLIKDPHIYVITFHLNAIKSILKNYISNSQCGGNVCMRCHALPWLYVYVTRTQSRFGHIKFDISISIKKKKKNYQQYKAKAACDFHDIRNRLWIIYTIFNIKITLNT